jgi:Fur family transcriptional regulator, peroxide stress response regulator
MNKTWEILSGKGLKSTPQRILIYETLMADHSHPSAEIVYEKIKSTHPTISLATVHKTLETLVEHQLAQKVYTVEGTFRYDGKINDHHHILIEGTNEIIDFDDELIKSLMKEHLKSKNIHNLEITNISIQISGRKIDPSQTVQISNNSL